jgi:hypothetical protein
MEAPKEYIQLAKYEMTMLWNQKDSLPFQK